MPLANRQAPTSALKASFAGQSVLQIGAGWLPEQDGGLNRVYHDLLKYLPGAGVDVVGLVQGSKGLAGQTGGAVRSFAGLNDSLITRWRGVRREARQVLREHSVPLVVSHFALFAFPVLKLMGDRPHVVHFHGPWALESKVERDHALVVRAKRAVEMAVYRHGSRFVVLSEAFRDILHEHYQVPFNRISVIPTGVNADHFGTSLSRREARERLGWPVDRPIVLSVRRLVQRMGLEHLVCAIAEVRRQVPDVLLLIAGRGPLTERIKELVQEKGLERNVRLLGFVPEEDLPLAYRAADLSIVPSVALEGMGCILLESMASGTPVMVTPVGGMPEAVRGLSTDLILPETGERAIAAALSDALTGRLALPSDEACREYIREHFDWPIIARRIGEVYASALR